MSGVICFSAKLNIIIRFMKIAILVHDLSSNSLVRVYPIAKVLARKHTVEVIGPYFSEAIFTAYSKEFVFKTVKGEKFPWFLRHIPNLIKSIQADIIYAFKPIVSSFGLGLLARYCHKIPLMLDIEDLDFEAWLTNFETRSFLFKSYSIAASLFSPKSELYAGLLAPGVKYANAVTVVSTFLQNRFGGTKLLHGADTEFFKPESYDRLALRTKYSISPQEKIILFGGTPRPHKGVDDLIEAIRLSDYKGLKLMLVGGRPDDPYLKSLCREGGPRIKHLGYQSHALMPEFLTVADMVVLPQRLNIIAKAQIPGKIFEAMAMAKPIVATQVSDLPEILEGCGVIVPPGNPPALAQAITRVLSDPQGALEMGWRARRRCEFLYSWNAMEVVLDKVMANVY
jgi:glycosyltransferase involved in cell wall biosynthesis